MTYDAKNTFVHLARYNQRANAELYAALSQLTDQARRRDVGSWFRSIHGLANHLIVADLFWLKRFRSILPDSKVLGDPALSPPNLSWQRDLCDDFSELAERRSSVDRRLIDWFQECPPTLYGQPFHYEDSAGRSRDAVAGRAFEFLFVHQVHHRGQLSQILDELGLPNNIADNGAFLEDGE